MGEDFQKIKGKGNDKKFLKLLKKNILRKVFPPMSCHF